MVSNLSRVRLVWKSMTSVSLWIRDLGGQPPHGKGPGEVPGPGGNTTDRAATAEET